MYSHNMVGSNDIDRSKKFYDALFTAIGGREGMVDPKGRLMYMHNDGVFMVSQPIDGQPATQWKRQYGRFCDGKPGAGGCLAQGRSGSGRNRN